MNEPSFLVHILCIRAARPGVRALHRGIPSRDAALALIADCFSVPVADLRCKALDLSPVEHVFLLPSTGFTDCVAAIAEDNV